MAEAFDRMDDLTGMLEGMFEDVMAQARSFQQGQDSQQASGGLGSSLMHFIRSVDWSERWIQAILASHAFVVLLAVLFRRSSAVQLAIFAWGATIIFFSEGLNRMGGDFWEEFATQPYFDKHGTFFSALVSLPLLLILVGVLINYLCHASWLMIRTKRKQLAHQALQNAKHGKAT